MIITHSNQVDSKVINHSLKQFNLNISIKESFRNWFITVCYFTDFFLEINDFWSTNLSFSISFEISFYLSKKVKVKPAYYSDRLPARGYTWLHPHLRSLPYAFLNLSIFIVNINNILNCYIQKVSCSRKGNSVSRES